MKFKLNDIIQSTLDRHTLGIITSFSIFFDDFLKKQVTEYTVKANNVTRTILENDARLLLESK